jgi:hypothetical protein
MAATAPAMSAQSVALSVPPSTPELHWQCEAFVGTGDNIWHEALAQHIHRTAGRAALSRPKVTNFFDIVKMADLAS